MSSTLEPLEFDSQSPRHGLPQLFPGQTQKEFTVNQALAKIDGLLHCTVLGEASSDPTNPADGDAWIVADAAGGLFAGHDKEVACRQAGTCLFAAGQPGMTVYDASAGQIRFFRNDWSVPSTPLAVSGGSVIDAEVRTALAALVEALAIVGIFPEQ